MRRPLSHRVRRLERRSAGCPECGWGGPETRFEVVVPEAVGRMAETLDTREPRRCPACGRPTEYVIAFPPARGRWAEKPAPGEQPGGHP